MKRRILSEKEKRQANKDLNGLTMSDEAKRDPRLLFQYGFGAGLNYSLDNIEWVQRRVVALLGYINGDITRAELEIKVPDLKQ